MEDSRSTKVMPIKTEVRSSEPGNWALITSEGRRGPQKVFEDWKSTEAKVQREADQRSGESEMRRDHPETEEGGKKVRSVF